MNAAPVNSGARERYLADFAEVEQALPGHDLAWLKRARRVAMEKFAELGFPTVRNEDWKYTNVAAIEKRPFKPAAKTNNGVSAAQLNEIIFSELDCHLLVFVNGHYAPGLSRVGALPAGATVTGLAQALEQMPDRLEPLFKDEAATNGFYALNTAFMQDGAYIHLAPGTVLEQPIHLLFVSGSQDTVAHPHNLIIAEESTEATIIEHYAGVNGASYFTNAVTRIFNGKTASLEHYKLQQESGKAFHIAGIHARQERDSCFVSHSIALGAQLSRNDITTLLGAEGCRCTLNGLYMVNGRQHVDHHTCIDHAKPHGTSREYYRGVLDGAARGVFNGKVIVQQDAQHTDAHQANKNLLLSKDAEVDTKPQLEIYADDVKCSHGATVGQLDTEMIFYLRSRGVGEDAAKSLLTYAFAGDIINRIKIAPMRARLEEILIQRLPQGNVIKELL